MNYPKNQHWVPCFYLKQFAIPETRKTKIPKVWAFSKKHHDPKEPHQISIKDAASSRFMYSPIDEKGNRDFKTEKKIEELETLTAQIWPDICNNNIAFSGHVRKLMSLFLATIMLRDQKSFNLIKNLHSKLCSFYEKFPKDFSGVSQVNKFIYKGKEYEIDLSDWQENNYHSDNYLRQFFVETINESAIDFAKILLKKIWSIRTFSKPILSTSDAPFIICNPFKDKFGIETKGTIVYFPLTPFLALEISDTGKNNFYYQMNDKYAYFINYLLWTNDCRFIFSHRNTDEVIYEIHKLVEGEKKELSGREKVSKE